MNEKKADTLRDWIILAIIGAVLIALVANLQGCGPIEPVEIPASSCEDPIYLEIAPVDLCTCESETDPDCQAILDPLASTIVCEDCNEAANDKIRNFNDRENGTGFVLKNSEPGIWTVMQRGTGSPNVGRCQTYTAALFPGDYFPIRRTISNPTTINPEGNTLRIQVGTSPASGCP